MDSHRPLRRIAKGRDLLPSDQGKRVIVVSGRVAAPLGLRVGDRLELGSRGELLSFEIVGITERSMISVGDGLVAPMGSFPAGTRLGAIYDVDLQGDRQQGIEGFEEEDHYTRDQAAENDTSPLDSAHSKPPALVRVRASEIGRVLPELFLVGPGAHKGGDDPEN